MSTPVKRSVGSLLTRVGSALMILGGFIGVASFNPDMNRSQEKEIDRELREIKMDVWLNRITEEEKIARLNRLEQRVESQSMSLTWLKMSMVTVAAVLGVSGGFLNRYGRRLAARGAEEVEQDDSRTPVILLRSFADDKLGSCFDSRLPACIPNFTGSALSREQVSFEQVVVEEFAKSGPVVAIGRPGETLPPLGAARTWVAHAEWQARVAHYLQRCRFVVMIVGTIKGEDGLAWELRQVLDRVPPEKIIFVVPPVEESEVWSRWTAFHERSSGRLPRYEGGELAAGFDADWKCKVVRVGGEGEYRHGLVTKYREELQSLIQRRQLDYLPVEIPEAPRPTNNDFNCPNCGVRVFPTSEGLCPSCRRYKWRLS